MTKNVNSNNFNPENKTLEIQKLLELPVVVLDSITQFLDRKGFHGWVCSCKQFNVYGTNPYFNTPVSQKVIVDEFLHLFKNHVSEIKNKNTFKTLLKLVAEKDTNLAFKILLNFKPLQDNLIIDSLKIIYENFSS